MTTTKKPSEVIAEKLADDLTDVVELPPTIKASYQKHIASHLTPFDDLVEAAKLVMPFLPDADSSPPTTKVASCEAAKALRAAIATLKGDPK